MQRRLLSLLLTFVLLVPLLTACAKKPEPTPAINSAVKLYQVLPVARDKSKFNNAPGEGEVIALINTSSDPQVINGWEIAASSGKVILPKLTLEPGKIIYLANDAEYFEKYWNFVPTFEYGTDTDQTVPDLKAPAEAKAPILNDQGDVVRLLDEAGRTVDILAYGSAADVPAPWTGPAVQLVNSFPVTPGNQVITRLKAGEGYKLEASAASWSGGSQTEPERVYFAGQSDFPVKSVTGKMTVTAASAPDNSAVLLYDMVAKAKKSIKIVGYQFNNKDLAKELVAAVKNGVRVTVGVDRNPGGGDMYESDKEAQEMLHKGGVEVLYYYKWDGDLSTRVNPVHSKYVIFDDESVLVSSGNFTNSVYPIEPTCGNREWFAVIQGNPDVVDLFKEIWAYDFGSNHAEVRTWNEKFDRTPQPDTYDPGPCLKYTPVKAEPLTVTGQATVTRILSPDNTMDRQFGFLGQLRGAKQELLISANYINGWWGKADEEKNLTEYPQPYLTEIIAAARRGVEVKVLMDAKNVKADSKRDNHYVVKYLNDLAAKEKLKLEARLVNADGSGIGRTYHNKSVIVDDAVIISSINGSENSFRYARELAIKVEGLPEFTGYFRDLFMADWEASAKPNYPTKVVAIPRNDGTYLDWVKNVELDVISYEIYYKAHPDAEWQKIKTTDRPGYTDSHTSGIWGLVAVTKSGVRSNYAEVAR